MLSKCRDELEVTEKPYSVYIDNLAYRRDIPCGIPTRGCNLFATTSAVYEVLSGYSLFYFSNQSHFAEVLLFFQDTDERPWLSVLYIKHV